MTVTLASASTRRRLLSSDWRRPAGTVRAAGRARRPDRASPARGRADADSTLSAAGKAPSVGPGRSSIIPSLNQSCAIAARIGGRVGAEMNRCPVSAPMEGGEALVQRPGGVHDDAVVGLGQHPFGMRAGQKPGRMARWPAHSRTGGWTRLRATARPSSGSCCRTEA